MTIGTGLFLGMACLAAVLLFLQTKDRWRWSAIVKWMFAIAITPVVIGSLYLGIEWARNYYDLHQPVTSYAGIALGDAMNDVAYKKGIPTRVLVDDPDNPSFQVIIDRANIPRSKTIEDYQYWEYDDADAATITVDFSATTHRVTSIYCYYSSGHECPSLDQITGGMTEDDVVQKLGSPTQSNGSTSFEGYRKVIRYPKIHVTYTLEKQRVYGLEVDAMSTNAQSVKTSFRAPPSSVAPPSECASAHSAEECADMLKKAGKNPFDAYGTVEQQPVYSGANPALAH